MKQLLSFFTAFVAVISLFIILTGFAPSNLLTNDNHLVKVKSRVCDTIIFECWGRGGSVLTANNEIVSNLAILGRVSGYLVDSTSLRNGQFWVNGCYLPSFILKVVKNNNDDIINGVTTFDIAKISRHIFGIETLASPYKLIAADADKSGEIDALDLLYLRRLILKLSTNVPAGNFRFVDKAYRFNDPENPFAEDFPEFVKLDSVTMFVPNFPVNFIAIKIGDVNDSYQSTIIRSSNKLIFNANDTTIEAGHEYSVKITADKLDVAAFQGTFSIEGAKVKSVQAGKLNNMTESNFGVFKNDVTVSWNGKTQEAADVLTINFVATKSGKLSEILTINSALTQAVANDADGSERHIQLQFKGDKRVGGEFALYQNQPNPIVNETSIGFNLPEDGSANLSIMRLDGKVVKSIRGNYKAGYNSITVDKADLGNGVFFYRLEMGDFSAVKKLVVFN